VYGRKVDGQSHHRRQTNPRIVDDYDRIFILTTLFRVPSEWGAPVEDTLCVSAPFVRWVVRPQWSWVIVTSSRKKSNIFFLDSPVMVKNTIPGTSKSINVLRTYPGPKISVTDREWTIFICPSKRDGGKHDVVSVVLEGITGGVPGLDSTVCSLWNDKARAK
jgi:hypothetical protein